MLVLSISAWHHGEFFPRAAVQNSNFAISLVTDERCFEVTRRLAP